MNKIAVILLTGLYISLLYIGLSTMSETHYYVHRLIAQLLGVA